MDGLLVGDLLGLPRERQAPEQPRVGVLDGLLAATGLGPRLELANQLLNPVQGIYDAGGYAKRAAAPGLTMGERFYEGVLPMATEIAGAVAPVAAGKIAGVGADDAAGLLTDALTNIRASQPAQAGRAFMADEYGGIRAYHGSPHDFDKFRMDKIGTGEGAQAYGHGLYFAENEGVARGYRDNLTEIPEILRLTGGDRKAAIDQVRTNIANVKDRIAESTVRADTPHGRKILKMWRDMLAKDEATLAELESGKVFGRMYEVEINANPEDFLDWDAPLSEQSEVMQRLEPVIADLRRRMVNEASQWGNPSPEEMANYQAQVDEIIGNMRGEEFMKAYEGDIAQGGSRNVARDAASWLNADTGTPGIRYLDAGSRGVGEGTRNYVVFDENLINIVRKYGIAGAAAMLGVSAGEVEAAMQGQEPKGLLQ